MYDVPLRHIRRAAGCAVALLILAGCGGGGGGSSPFASMLPAPTADADSFYAEPADLPAEPGTILKSRAITYQPLGVERANAAWQLQYVTRGADGQPRAAVATIVQPLTEYQRDPPVLLAFQHAYDSLGAVCTPSHTATGGTDNVINMAESLEFLPSALTRGWTLVIPDYEGPDHAFGAGPLAGRATLDAVRAALQFEPLALPADTPVGLWGYSGGGYATAWAAALKADYAPEIDIVGAAIGGALVDPLAVVRSNEGGDNFNFFFTLVMGLARDYPALLSADQLTAAGATAVEALKNACVGVPADGVELDGEKVADYVAAADPYALSAFQSVGDQVNLLLSASAPTAPLYVYHEIDDDLVPIDDVDTLVEQWCEAGTPLAYHRSDVGVDPDLPQASVHISGAATGAQAAITYLQSRYAGLATPVTLYGADRCN